MKICELKIKDMASVNSISQALLLNGYSAKLHTKFKEFPRETRLIDKQRKEDEGK